MKLYVETDKGIIVWLVPGRAIFLLVEDIVVFVLLRMASFPVMYVNWLAA